jgi:penicillin-binding protein 1C
VTGRGIAALALAAAAPVVAFGLFRFSAAVTPVAAKDLPGERFESVRFLDRHGRLLQEVLSLDSSRSVRVPLSRVSPSFIQAILSAEDRRFLSHGGVDYPAVARATVANLRAGRIVSGGSTVTCQLARLVRPAPRTVATKFREWHLAFRMEAGMSKAEILEEYVNRLPMGGNLYGVEAGARGWLGVSASDLTVAQAAYLAAIPNAPSRLTPRRDAGALRARQKRIIAAMARCGAIGSAEAARSAKEEVAPLPAEASFIAPHLVFRLLRELPPGSREVITTIDADLQRRATRLVAATVSSLRGQSVTNGAALIIDNATGETLAYVGSTDWLSGEDDGRIDGAATPRQPGSALKPFLYSLAFERDFTPASVLPDVPAFYRIPEGLYSPRNYSKVSYGPVRLRAALANSLNIPAVRLTDAVGVEPFLSRLKALGFASLTRGADHYGLGLVLGGGEVTLTELAGGYLALARGGRYAPPLFVLAVDGKRTPRVSPVPVIDPRAASQVTDILSDRFARSAEFGVDSVLAFPFACAAKTGTSWEYHDNWTAGYTSEQTVAVWVGNFDRRPMQRVSGVTGAGPLFARLISDLYRGADDPERFVPAPGLAEITVCALSGKSPRPWCPHTVSERVREEERNALASTPCDLHVRQRIDLRNGLLATGRTPEAFAGERVFAALPPAYRDWYRAAGVTPPPTAASPIDGDGGPAATRGATSLAITRPADGAVFARLPDLAADYQSIRFAATGDGAEVVRWLLDGRELGTTEGGRELLWTAEPGEHELVARTDGSSDRVRFRVK